MNREQEEPDAAPARSVVAEVVEALIARLIEVEQREIALERHHVEMAGQIQKLATVLKITQDNLDILARLKTTSREVN